MKEAVARLLRTGSRAKQRDYAYDKPSLENQANAVSNG